MKNAFNIKYLDIKGLSVLSEAFYFLFFLILSYSFYTRKEAQSHIYAIVPPLGGWCLRLLVLSDLAEVGLPP